MGVSRMLYRLVAAAFQTSTYDLKLYSLSLQFNCTNLEVDSNCADVTFCVCVVGETKEQARLGKSVGLRTKESAITNLSNTGIANEEKLEEIIVFTCMHGGMGRGEDVCWVTYKVVEREGMRQHPKPAAMAVHVARSSRRFTHPHWPDSHSHRPSPAVVPKVCITQSTQSYIQHEIVQLTTNGEVVQHEVHHTANKLEPGIDSGEDNDLVQDSILLEAPQLASVAESYY